MRSWMRASVAAVLLGALSAAWGQGARVYTCTDAQGRRLTSDRPIAECLDREQKVLGDSGTVRAVVPPTLSAREQEARAELEKRAAEEKQKQADARRAERALAARYPSQAVHDLERAKALKAVQDVAVAMQRHLDELQSQKKKLLEETEFYKNPAQYPPKLKRQLEENEQSIAAQHRGLANQAEERKRLTAKFDDELARLKVLWSPVVAPVAPTAMAASGSARR